ncbi:remorin 1.4-like [Syzygium oleosum]|uniref:remorin 1.4-like n=1 Tax=Syzygium oleosum TaxID=219896 RepID=UPI0011D1BB20|nr:remorin 1.4-like [Syzygium oleosum]
MEQLLKQARLKFSGVGQEKAEGSSTLRDRKMPAQKTQSFKGDKRSQSWLQRQFSKQMSRSDGYSAGEDELAAAVAAAAFAVNNLEGSASPKRSPTSTGPKRTLTKAKSKRQNASTPLENGAESMDSLDRKIPIAGPAQPVQKRPTFAEKLLEDTEDAKEGAPAPPKPSPSIKKASSSADKQFKKATSMKPETSSPTSEQLSTIKPPAPPPPEFKTRQSSAIPGGESKADAWIRQEMSRIRERYDNLKTTIVSWETEKKKKARRKLDVKESEVERKRAKALQSFRAEMERIEKIAAAARAQAEDRQKSEESKAQDKAHILRTTGKLPKTCFCF